MQVIIKEREFEYTSDYNIGWQFSSGDDFKFPVKIGGRHSCFVKRFARNPEKVSGWQLLQALRATSQPGLPRIHDIVQTEEKGGGVRYLFYECLEGDTLDHLVREGEVPDMGRLTEDLFKALKSIHRYEHWMSDFCEKNIFCKKDGGFCLIDLDSTQPVAFRPDNEMYGNKEYWAVPFSYLINRVGLNGFRPGDISGALLNYLQVVFLVLRIRAAIVDKIGDYKSTTFYHRLPDLLDQLIPDYRDLFSDLVKNGVSIPEADSIRRIKELLLTKIVNGQPEYDAPPQPYDPKPYDPLPQPDDPLPPKHLPVVRSFTSDAKRLKKGGPFTLSWEVDYGESISICRNGLPYKNVPKGSGALTLMERYDGKEKKIDYSLKVANAAGFVNSQQLLLYVGPREIKARPFLFLTGGVLVLFLLVVLVVKGIHLLWPPAPPPPPVRYVHDTVNTAPPMVLGGDKFKQLEDSLNNDRQQKMKKETEDKAAEEARKVLNSIKGKQTASKETNITPVVDLTPPPPVIDEAAIQREKRRVRLFLQKRVAEDSVRVIDTTFSKKIVFPITKSVRMLGIQNRSGFFLDTVVVQISPGGAEQPYQKSFYNIKANSFSILIDKLPKGKHNWRATLVSVAF